MTFKTKFMTHIPVQTYATIQSQVAEKDDTFISPYKPKLSKVIFAKHINIERGISNG